MIDEHISELRTFVDSIEWISPIKRLSLINCIDEIEKELDYQSGKAIELTEIISAGLDNQND